MKVLDELIADELDYYREYFRSGNIAGLLGA